MMLFYFLAGIVIVAGGVSLFLLVVGAGLTAYDWLVERRANARAESMVRHPSNRPFDWEVDFTEIADR